MSTTAIPPADAPDSAQKKSVLRPVLLGFLAAVILGGGAFYAVFTGLILSEQQTLSHNQPTTAETVFVALDTITVSPPPERGARFIRLAVQIEASVASEAEVRRLTPRFIDMINTYLHAVDLDDLRQPAALIRLRSQLLRRTQLIAGEGHVSDVLITEFIID